MAISTPNCKFRPCTNYNKQNTHPEQYISCFNEIKDAYKHYENIFTDGSKQQHTIGATKPSVTDFVCFFYIHCRT